MTFKKYIKYHEKKHLSGILSGVLRAFIQKIHSDNIYYRILVNFSNYESYYEYIVKFKSEDLECSYVRSIPGMHRDLYTSLLVYRSLVCRTILSQSLWSLSKQGNKTIDLWLRPTELKKMDRIFKSYYFIRWEVKKFVHLCIGIRIHKLKLKIELFPLHAADNDITNMADYGK